MSLHTPGSGRATTLESLAGALGIPDCLPPNRRRTFKVNLHTPGNGRVTTLESLAGALGIPDYLPPNRRRIFKVKKGERL